MNYSLRIDTINEIVRSVGRPIHFLLLPSILVQRAAHMYSSVHTYLYSFSGSTYVFFCAYIFVFFLHRCLVVYIGLLYQVATIMSCN